MPLQRTRGTRGIGGTLPTNKVNPTALRTAATHSEEMQAGIGTALESLNAQHQGMTGQTEGFEFTGELMRTHQSWHERLTDIQKECGEVTRSLRDSADNYEKNDETTAQSFTRSAAGSSVSICPAKQSSARLDSPFG
ncbi:type VII secretion target [Streptomyces noursei]|uniref:type VII secretion target n=1 Tax=Streptomyces noursei TaxID=1971 RepID=UPI00099669AB